MWSLITMHALQNKINQRTQIPLLDREQAHQWQGQAD